MKITEIIDNELPKSEPLIKTHLQPFWLAVFNYAFTKMVKKGFYSLKIKNAENYNLRDPNKSNIIYANHCCWWDGIIGYLLCNKIFKTNMHMMIEELRRFPLLSKIGAFSVEKDSPQSAVKALNYSLEVLENPENSLWIFPQGSVNPPDYRPIKFASGISYLYKKSNGVNLIPIAHRYNFIREDRPEIFIEIGKPVILDGDLPENINRKKFTQFLEDNFTNLLDKQRENICQGNMEGYELFFQSRLCLAKLIEKHFTWFVRTFNA